MEENKSKVYILLDEDKIVRCEGGYTMNNIANIDEWIYIDEGEGDKYNLCQTHYFEGGLTTEEGIYRYKYVDGKCVPREPEDIEAEKASIVTPISESDRLEAQVTYTAMMTDTLLEV